jgi:hypothetical protein
VILSRLEFGDSTIDAAEADPGYIIRVEEKGAVSVVSTMTEGIGDDEADSVGPAQCHSHSCSLAKSAGEVGDEPRSLAIIHPGAKANGKRVVRADDGPADSEQSTLKNQP